MLCHDRDMVCRLLTLLPTARHACYLLRYCPLALLLCAFRQRYTDCRRYVLLCCRMAPLSRCRGAMPRKMDAQFHALFELLGAMLFVSEARAGMLSRATLRQH